VRCYQPWRADHFSIADRSVALMRARANAPHAVLVVAAGGEPLVISVDKAVPCDLALVDRLLWLRLTVARMGWRLRVEYIDDDLAELLDLVGVADSLGLR
jgi:hypothetical protein